MTFETAKGKPVLRSSDSNGPDNLYRSSDLGEPHLSGSQCCDEVQILLRYLYSLMLQPKHYTPILSITDTYSNWHLHTLLGRESGGSNSFSSAVVAETVGSSTLSANGYGPGEDTGC